MAGRYIWMVVVVLGGCVANGPKYPTVRGVQIVSDAEASAEDWTKEPMSLRFGDGQDGTALVVRFLDAAAKRGAVAVGDLRIVQVTTSNGKPVECVTEIELETEIKRRTEAVYTPSKTRTRLELKPVTRTVTEHEYTCEMVSKPVTHYETVYESSYDDSSKSYRSSPKTRAVTRYESTNECSYEPVTRTVTRHEYEHDTEYIPPSWDYISRTYADHKLVEQERLCTPTDNAAPGARAHTISGVLYRNRAAVQREAECRDADRRIRAAATPEHKRAIARETSPDCFR